MLSDTFQIILMKILNNIEIDSNKLERILEYIQTKPIESYVYPEIRCSYIRLYEGICILRKVWGTKASI